MLRIPAHEALNDMFVRGTTWFFLAFSFSRFVVSFNNRDPRAAIATHLLYAALVEDDARDEECQLVDIHEQDCWERVVAQPEDCRDRRNDSETKGQRGCDYRQRDANADIFNGVVDTILWLFLWIGSVLGAGDNEGIVQADSKDHKGKDLRNGGERNSFQMSASGVSDTGDVGIHI
jgi:hypothetical protein